MIFDDLGGTFVATRIPLASALNMNYPPEVEEFLQTYDRLLLEHRFSI